MKPSRLSDLLTIEGQVPAGDEAQYWAELAKQPELDSWARTVFVAFTTLAVIMGYKVAAGLRTVASGYNTSEKSRALFRAFADDMLERAADETLPAWLRALCWHNAASAMANHNGGDPKLQTEYNVEALRILDDVPEAERCANWRTVQMKVGVGLYENGAVPFDETNYLMIIETMARENAKDLANRLKFMSERYCEVGRHAEAKALIAKYEDRLSGSATNQVEELNTFRRRMGLMSLVALLGAHAVYRLLPGLFL